jgi:lysophospholipase L1-like esterase
MFDITQIPNRVLDVDPSVAVYKDTGGTIPATADGDVVKCWKDQSGNSNDFTTSGTGGTPQLKLNQFGTLPAIYVAPTSNNQLQSALNFSSSGQAYTIKIVAKGATYGGTYNPFLNFSGTTNAFCGIRSGSAASGTGGATYTLYPSFATSAIFANSPGATVIYNAVCDGTNALSYVNGGTSAAATNAAFTIGHPCVGGFSLESTDESIYIARILIFSRVLTTQEHQEIDSALYAKYAPSAQLYFEGDSLTAGVNSSTNHDYPSQTVALLASAGIANPNWLNDGFPGRTLATMVTNAATHEDAGAAISTPSVMVAFGGTNDNALSGTASKAIYDLAVKYGAARKVFCPQRKVVLLSMLPRGTDATIEARRVAFNALLANDFQVRTAFTNVFAANPGVFYADYLIRLDLDANIGFPGCSTNATWYEQAQQTHLTDAGYAIVAGCAAGAIRAALSGSRGAVLSIGDGITV